MQRILEVHTCSCSAVSIFAAMLETWVRYPVVAIATFFPSVFHSGRNIFNEKPSDNPKHFASLQQHFPLPSLCRIDHFCRKNFKGTWCSGITPAQHAGGPGFNPQCVHREFRAASARDSARRSRDLADRCTRHLARRSCH